MADTDPPLDYAPPDPNARRRRLMLQIGIVVGCVLLLFAGICGFAARKAVTQVNQIHCAAGLRNVAEALQFYIQDYRVRAPDLQSVLRTQSISTESFICPASSDRRAQVARAFGAPGTCSYIYVGVSLPVDARIDTVIMLEDPANHSMDGGHVVYAGGSIQWVSMPYLIQILNDLQQGLNPPSATTTLTTAQAAKIYNTKWKPLMPQLKSGVWRIPTTGPTTVPARPQ